jgi:hypothetical protein
MSTGIQLPTYEELNVLTESLANLDITAGQTMAEVRRIQKWHYQKLFDRFDDINSETLKRYMQRNYHGMRPIHVLAAFSWVTMIPMAGFFNELKALKTDKSMDNDSWEAIIRCARLSSRRFSLILEVIRDFHSNTAKKKYLLVEESVANDFGTLDKYDADFFMPPKKVSMKTFGNDYYYSIAESLKEFRCINQLSFRKLAEGLGLSLERYALLEDESISKINKPFSLHISARLRLVFHSCKHVEFTKYMKVFPQFHSLLAVQNVRNLLIFEALRHVSNHQKKPVINIMNEIASAQEK